MGLFKTRVDENWKINYIKEFNEMRSEYEKKILSKQNEIDDLKKQLEELKCFRSNLRPKEKQIKDSESLFSSEKLSRKLSVSSEPFPRMENIGVLIIKISSRPIKKRTYFSYFWSGIRFRTAVKKI